MWIRFVSDVSERVFVPSLIAEISHITSETYRWKNFA